MNTSNSFHFSRYLHFQGMPVYGIHGEMLGELYDLVISDSGEVLYGIVEVCHSLSGETRWVGFLWSEFTFTHPGHHSRAGHLGRTHRFGLTLSLDRETIQSLPGLDPENLPAWYNGAVQCLRPTSEEETYEFEASA